MLRLALTVLLCASFVSAIDYSNITTPQQEILSDNCQSPDKQQGVCIPIKDCPVLFSFIEDGKLTSAIISYLRQAQCGFAGKIPKVCCPKNPPNNQTNNETSTTNNQTSITTNQTSISNNQTSTTNKKTSVGLNLLPSEETCGLSSTDKLLGGYLANLDEYPWAVLLMSQTEAYCGGTLINNRYVLTTGYCIHKNNLTMVRLGENDLTTNPDCVQYGSIKHCVDPYIDLQVEKTIVHEDYSLQEKTTINDIALVRLNKPVKFNDFVRPLCLPITEEVKNKNYTNKFITRIGWGTIHKGNLNSQKMKQPVTVVENEECNKRYPLNLTKKQICTVTRGDRQCIGDIGGAVCDYRTDTGTYYAVGVTSGAACTLDHPAVYTKVSEYMDWILKHLEE